MVHRLCLQTNVFTMGTERIMFLLRSSKFCSHCDMRLLKRVKVYSFGRQNIVLIEIL